MRIAGIDYGSKRIGLAVSDESGTLAFPKKVVQNTADAVALVAAFIKENTAERVVVGESKKLTGEANIIQKDAIVFRDLLAQAVGFAVDFEPEQYSSFEAERFQEKDEMLDARAAAIILQRYLDRRKHTEAGTNI
jgi:putative Holliday junction resolvase